MDSGPWTLDHGPLTMDQEPWNMDYVWPMDLNHGPWTMYHGLFGMDVAYSCLVLLIIAYWDQGPGLVS